MKNKTSVFSDAVYNKKICEITYHSRKGEVTTRKILPHAITIREGQWYVYAFCQKRKAFRLFKLSRVYSVVLSDETFERLPLPDKNEIFASRDHGRWSFRVLWNRRKRDMIDQRQNQEICYYRRFIDKGLFAIT